ncbi:MAG: rhodanese-like domain-containing protein [Gammaproteobacteria bacterium]|nr:rhodanese-like domain-containing protein [Gammaproteobacteria bacterium]
MSELPIVNISGYKFVSLSVVQLPLLRDNLKEKAIACDLKGTILLSSEGINSFLAGMRDNIDRFVNHLRTLPEFTDIWYKESFTDYQPFNRMLVRLKKEIIPMNNSAIIPEKKTAPYISPEELKQWYEEKRDMIVLDTRNDFEVSLGTFENAMDLNIAHFREFSDAVDLLPADAKEKPIVTFCTGGIRCEKAAELMEQKGFKNVYQLNGGILNYFEKCGGDFYTGDCFVFDQRVAVNSELKETTAKQCFDCRTPLVGSSMICSNCGSNAVSKMGIGNQKSGIHSQPLPILDPR